MATNELLKSGIEKYTERTVEQLDVHADPRVCGAYALRAKMDDGETIDFLLCAGWEPLRGRPTVDHVADALEEAMFSSWPPKSGKVQWRAHVFS